MHVLQEICILSTYLYGASARAAAAISGSHLSPVVVVSLATFHQSEDVNSPFVSSFSLLYNNSSLVSVAYSAFGAAPMSACIHYHILHARRTLDNGIHWAALLAQATVDALRHVNIISRRPPAAVHALFCFNCDCLRRADGLTQLASNAAFLAGGISS